MGSEDERIMRTGREGKNIRFLTSVDVGAVNVRSVGSTHLFMIPFYGAAERSFNDRH